MSGSDVLEITDIFSVCKDTMLLPKHNNASLTLFKIMNIHIRFTVSHNNLKL